jgi:hypothetical protein
MPISDIAALKKAHAAIEFESNCDAPLIAFGDSLRDRIRQLETGQITAGQWRLFATRDIKILDERLAKGNKAKELITSRTELEKADTRDKLAGVLRDIQKFENRLLASVVTTQIKTATSPITSDEVADFLVVPRGVITVGDKNRTRKLDVKKDSPFEGANLLRGDVSTSYGTGLRFLALTDLNVSFTHTSLTDPEFGTVTEKAPTAEDPNATKLVIAQKSEKERSGKLAVIVSLPVFYRAESPAARRIGLDIGVGASTDFTALFLGASYKLTRAIRLGAGRTWQQVTALDEQKIGETVVAADNVKTKQELESDWYVSFSFSLGSLKLFKDE